MSTIGCIDAVGHITTPNNKNKFDISSTCRCNSPSVLEFDNIECLDGGLYLDCKPLTVALASRGQVHISLDAREAACTVSSCPKHVIMMRLQTHLVRLLVSERV